MEIFQRHNLSEKFQSGINTIPITNCVPSVWTDRVNSDVLICLRTLERGDAAACLFLAASPRGRQGLRLVASSLSATSSSSSAQTNSTQLWTRITWHLLPQGQQPEMWVPDFLWSATRRSACFLFFFRFGIPQNTPNTEEPKIYSTAWRDFDNLLPSVSFSPLDIWSSVLSACWTLTLLFWNHCAANSRVTLDFSADQTFALHFFRKKNKWLASPLPFLRWC